MLSAITVSAVNPYLPLWEHLPDGEPRVFEDPDNPGKYRIYIIGSHDLNFHRYCGPDIRVWSAPVDDLTDWRDDGAVFTFQDPITLQWDTMFAPDMVEVLRRDENGERTIREYYLYPHSRGPGREAMVAKSHRPDGLFVPINLAENGRALLPGSIMGFDPAVYVEYIDDPNDPDYEIGFRAYGYWGFQAAFAAELDQNTMWSLRPGTQIIRHFIPSSHSFGNLRDPEGTTYPHIFDDEDLTTFNYFEAFSIRKVGNKYVNIFSGYSGPEYGLGSTNSALRYMFADHPLGPWRSGGVLVDSRAPVPNQDGTKLMTSGSAHNTHGGIEYINGQWFAFYHRSPRGFGNARQAMVAPVHIEWDEKPVADGGRVTIRGFDPYADDKIWTATAADGTQYTGAEVTSEGFQIYGLPPYRYYSAGIASYFSHPNTLQSNWDIWDNHMPIEGMTGNHIVGYKYFDFRQTDNNTEFNLWLTPKNENEFKINIWLDGPWDNDTWNGTKIGEITVPANPAWEEMQEVTKFTADVSAYVENLTQKNAVFLVGEGSGAVDLIGLGFSSDANPIERRKAPTAIILVDGERIELPTTPVRSTAANGITGYNYYEAVVIRPDDAASIPNITVGVIAGDPVTTQTITQPDNPFGTATVEFDFNGTVKTYTINFEPETEPEEPDPAIQIEGMINFALASQGASVELSPDYENEAGNVIDGDINHPGHDATNISPARIRWEGDEDRWAEITFSEAKLIHRVHVVSQANNNFAGNPNFETKTTLGLATIMVSVWDGLDWVEVGRGAGDNELVIQQFKLNNPVKTDKIRIDFPAGAGVDGWVRVVQIEAWGEELPTAEIITEEPDEQEEPEDIPAANINEEPADKPNIPLFAAIGAAAVASVATIIFVLKKKKK